AGVGLTLAALTTVLFGSGFTDGSFGGVTLVVGLPTWLLGTFWAMLLRWRVDIAVGSRKIRAGWLLSIPLAAANGGLAAGILFASEGPYVGFLQLLEKFLGGVVLGVTLGALIWVPALILTLIFFGLPIAQAQRHALQGLSGEERGERTVGLTNLVLSLVAFTILASSRNAAAGTEWYSSIGFWTLVAMVSGGMLTGSLAAAFSALRERDRTRFIAAVEHGQVKGYRIEPTPEGKVLLRVSVSSEGEGYRAAEFDEELVALDTEGHARQELSPRILSNATYW
ncbi:MAG: hypothetical protein RMJ98_18815, partial [Myxococcales bacterium]|nr:hypothetical protein [Polyangiaceae bacterium]MDW8251353.1 hypothetical protein [Myxococcales bacterium]